MYCKMCGQKLKDSDKSCPVCGWQVDQKTAIRDNDNDLDFNLYIVLALSIVLVVLGFVIFIAHTHNSFEKVETNQYDFSYDSKIWSLLEDQDEMMSFIYKNMNGNGIIIYKDIKKLNLSGSLDKIGTRELIEQQLKFILNKAKGEEFEILSFSPGIEKGQDDKNYLYYIDYSQAIDGGKIFGRFYFVLLDSNSYVTMKFINNSNIPTEEWNDEIVKIANSINAKQTSGVKLTSASIREALLSNF